MFLAITLLQYTNVSALTSAATTALRKPNAQAQTPRRVSVDIAWNQLLAVLPFNEVITVNLLRFVRSDGSDPNIMVDHELGQLLAVNEHDL